MLLGALGGIKNPPNAYGSHSMVLAMALTIELMLTKALADSPFAVAETSVELTAEASTLPPASETTEA